MPYGLQSTEEQLAAARDEAMNGVAFVHIDTCLGSFLQDHHNRPGECLFGVPVNGDTTIGDVYSALIDEVRATGDRIPSVEVSDAALDRAILDLFNGVPFDKLFDASLEPPVDSEDFADFDEPVQAWFVLTWNVNEEEEDA